MGQRGKKSTAALEVVQPNGVTAVRRPDPPEDLTDEQAHEWRSVVNRMPSDWFPRETHPLLAQYCRHASAAKHIAELIENLMASAAEENDWLGTYDKLLKMQDREGRALSSLATKMRVSQHAQYNSRKKSGTNLPRPWET